MIERIACALALAACGYPRPTLGDGTNGDSPDTSCHFQTIAVGRDSTCAIDRDAAVWCWGGNAYGQVSPGGPDPIVAATRVALPTGSVAVELGLGKKSACARLDDGTVWCWGDNSTGALGDGTTANHGPTQVLLDNERAVELRVGAQHACIRRASDLAIECWGDNGSFALGNTGAAIQPTPQVIAGTTGTMQFALGHRHGCFVDTTGRASCWGRNIAGELGTLPVGTDRANVMPVSGLGAVVRMGATGLISCAIDGNGDLRCWGGNSSGDLGDGTFLDPQPMPGGVVDTNVVDVELGPFAAWALHGDGTIAGWGSSSFDGVLAIRTTATASQLTGVTQLAAAFFHTCAMVGGQAMCWGQNGAGQLGRGKRSGANPPTLVTLPAAVDVFAVASDPRACVHAGGKIYCWGFNDTGELGDGGLVSSAVPLEVASGLATNIGVAMTWQHACAWGGGVARCWGDNTWGQLAGIAEPDPAHHRGSLPVTPSVANVTSVVTGQQFSCALTNTPAVQCWGRNLYGSLGNGSANNTISTPVTVSNLTSPTQLVSGLSSVCVIDGMKLKCWGDNRYGQIGDGSNLERSTPVPVVLSGDQNAMEIALGRAHACALTPSGEVDCWGANNAGQLGLGDMVDRAAPTKVPLPPADPAKHVFAGWEGTCAQLTSGLVDCWGNVGGLASTSSPLEVVLLHAASSIAISSGGGCMQKQGQLSCWGDRLLLGDGDTSDWQAQPVTLTCGGS